jgi:hypothetical protein
LVKAVAAYMAAARYEQFTAADPNTHTTGLHLIAHEDVALKAYADPCPLSRRPPAAPGLQPDR